MTEVRTPSGKLKSGEGLELFWRGWVPEAPVAVLLFVHGLAEHSGRYERTARHFAGRGLACYGFDLRGHGLSEGHRVHVNRFEDYLADLDLVLDLVRARHPALPLFLVGHSMGGTIVISRSLARQDGVEGAVVSSPLLGTHPKSEPPALVRAAAGMLSRIAPRLLMATNLDAAGLSHDPAVVEAYEQDPLVSHQASPRWYTETMAAIARAHAQAGSFKIPMLLMQSGADPLVDPEATRRWAKAAPAQFVEFVWWEGFYHNVQRGAASGGLRPGGRLAGGPAEERGGHLGRGPPVSARPAAVTAFALALLAGACASPRLPKDLGSDHGLPWVTTEVGDQHFSVALPGSWSQSVVDEGVRDAILAGLKKRRGDAAEAGSRSPEKDDQFFSSLRFYAQDAADGRVRALFMIFRLPLPSDTSLDDAAREYASVLIWDPGIEKPFVLTTVNMPAGRAKHLRYRMDVATKKGDVYALSLATFLLRHGGGTYLLMCVSPDAYFKAYEPVYEKVLKSFAFLPAEPS